MVVTPLRVLLFVVAAVSAAAGTAYVAGGFDSYLGKEPVSGAAAPEKLSGGKSARLEKAPEETDGETTPEQAVETTAEAASAAKPEVVVPSFDLVRVEPSGSIVIAGSAAPNANIEVVAGATMIGKAQSGPGGDFAIVLDEPLDPGDYQLVLRSTTDDGIAATSTETAVVSVPEEEGGQVLALVEQPGEPSKLITVPEPRDGTDAAPASGQQPAAIEDDAPTQEADGRQTAGARTEQDAASWMEDLRPTKQPENQNDSGTSTDVARNEDPAAPKARQSSGNGSDMAGEGASREQNVAAMPQPDAGRAAASQGSSEVFIEAVEIDGKQVFVAGNAEPGSRVRVYANDILLGEAEVASTGRFLVETIRDLPVGDYIVRADVLDENGTDVAARAAVPFRREPGESIAAVAPATRNGPQGAGEPQAATGADSGEVQSDASSGPQTIGRTDDSSATTGGTSSQGLSEDAVGESEQQSAAQEEPAGEVGSSENRQADTAPGASDAAPVESDTGSAEETETAMAPRLEPVDGAVIIRRGDTLWHISRRVYGRGIRYTTIYLANQQQIRDPDLIWPGQVFTVPEETEEGEQADMKAIGDQAVPPPKR